jgi:exosortase A-associated hydrolase 1
MDPHMRRTLSFACKGEMLAATLDEAAGTIGLLIVSGGNEIRIGAHRGMATLAADVAAKGYPVFRFDRRGIGDSSGDNLGFQHSGPDLDGAVHAFRAECPHITDIICFGNCDAATALILSETPAKALILANPWVIEPIDDLPPTAAIKARYSERLRDPKTWRRLVKGEINLRKAVGGMLRIAKPETKSSLSGECALSLSHLQATPSKITILLATGDATAIAFAAEWEKPHFRSLARSAIEVHRFDSASHSFACDADYAVLQSAILGALAS